MPPSTSLNCDRSMQLAHDAIKQRKLVEMEWPNGLQHCAVACTVMGSNPHQCSGMLLALDRWPVAT